MLPGDFLIFVRLQCFQRRQTENVFRGSCFKIALMFSLTSFYRLIQLITMMKYLEMSLLLCCSVKNLTWANFRQAGQMIELCSEYLPVRYI